MPKRPYPRHRRRHNAILVAALENPALKQKEIAKATGYSESQVSRIMSSPDFQELYDLFLWETALKHRSKSLA
jgi:hypothetical protein